MARIVSAAAAADSRRQHTLDGVTYWRTDYFNTAGEAPQAFIVEKSPGDVSRPHFHRENEFQVFVRGAGLFGRHAVRAYAVHYSGAYTGYGPIVPGEQGLAYFTLRDRHDSAAFYLPESMPRMRRVPKTFRLSEPVPVDPSQLATLDAVQTVPVLAREADGLASVLLRVPARQQALAPAPQGSGGQFLVVVGGSLQSAGEALGVHSCIAVAADEDAFALRAGDAGAEVLVLQFPRRAAWQDESEDVPAAAPGSVLASKA